MNTRYYLRLLRTLALAALTAAATAACSDDTDTDREPLTPPDGADGIAVNFTADINPGSDADPAAAPGTRTVLTPDGNGGFTVEWKGRNDNPNNCDLLYIWAVKGTTKIGPKTYIPTTSGASSVLVPEDDTQKLTLTEPGEWKFTAIYGVYSFFMDGEPAIDLSILPLQSAPGSTEHIASRDLSVATTTQTVEANTAMPQSINLKFEHKFSALQLRVTNATGEALTVKEIHLSVTGDQIACQRYYDIAMGDWKATGEAKRDYLKLTASSFPALPSDGTAQDFHMLLFPGYANTDMTITVITDRGEYALTKTAPASPGFEAGHNYMTDITIKTDGLDPDTETWTETISNKAELAAFRERVNGGNKYDGATVRLTADIDLANETWTPIGTDYSKCFSGTFDGGGYHISKLSVDNGSNNYAGLFGFVSGGTVRNLRVSGTVTTTGSTAGGIAGELYGSTVENCIFDGDVSGRSYVGGIAGDCNNSRIAGCHTKGKIKATSSYAGGIAGYNSNNSTIDGCYSEAEVTAGSRAGGIAGTNQGSTITHCYATGKVSGKSHVGGIVGWNLKSVTGCIALNPGLTRTEGIETYFGRIVGHNQGTSTTVTSCGAYDGMTLPDGVTVTSAADGIHGATLTAADCLTPAAYTSRDFTEATATTPGWAFDSATPWTYLPWNKVFQDWNLPADTYRIPVPAHLTSGGTN